MNLSDSLPNSSRNLIGPCLGLGLLAACAQEPVSAPPSASVPRALEGVWEDDRGSDTVKITIEGNSLHFYERPDFQYDTTFTLVPGTDPQELHATILDSPKTTDGAGRDGRRDLRARGGQAAPRRGHSGRGGACELRERQQRLPPRAGLGSRVNQVRDA